MTGDSRLICDESTKSMQTKVMKPVRVAILGELSYVVVLELGQ